MGEQTVRDWIVGKTMPSLRNLAALAHTLGVSVEWLATGRGGPASPQPSDTGIVHVPVLDVALSAGHGTYPPETEEPQDSRPFRLMDLKQLSNSTRNLHIVRVRGDSMAPLLEDKDEVMIDGTPPEVLTDGLYAVHWEDVLMIKRVRRLPGKRVQLRSENPQYEPIEIDLTDEAINFRVIGTVVWAAKRF